MDDIESDGFQDAHHLHIFTCGADRQRHEHTGLYFKCDTVFIKESNERLLTHGHWEPSDVMSEVRQSNQNWFPLTLNTKARAAPLHLALFPFLFYRAAQPQSRSQMWDFFPAQACRAALNQYHAAWLCLSGVYMSQKQWWRWEKGKQLKPIERPGGYHTKSLIKIIQTTKDSPCSHDRPKQSTSPPQHTHRHADTIASTPRYIAGLTATRKKVALLWAKGSWHLDDKR